MFTRRFIACLGLGVILTSINASAEAPSSVLFRERDLAVKQFVVPGFETLTLDRKLFVYHMAKAIQSGRNITWMQNSKEGLAIRDLFESVWPEAKKLPKDKQYAITQYMYRLYRNHANYDWFANCKFVPEGISYEDIATLLSDDAHLPKGQLPKLRDELARLKDQVFNPDFRPLYLAKEGEKLIEDSNSNYYGPGVTTQMVQALPDALRNHPMSYPTLASNGEITMDYYRIGQRFDKQLAAIDKNLALAHQYANEKEKAIIEAFRKVLVTADPADFDAANILWVQNKSADVDFMQGFIEDYHDPLEVRGTWEGYIYLTNLDPAARERIENIKKNFQYFEENMPVDEAFKKKTITNIPQSEEGYFISGAGDCGESPFSGVNLPNNRDITVKYGSKSYTALNVIQDIGQDPAIRKREIELFYSDKYADELATYNFDLGLALDVTFHEVLGHGSGKLADDLTNDEADTRLKEYGSTLEECRASVAALYHITDFEHLVEFGILPATMSLQQAESFSRMAVIAEVTAGVRNLVKRVGDDTKEIRQAHLRGRQVTRNFLIKNGALVPVVKAKTGITVFEMPSLDQTRKVLGDLWRQLQECRSNADYQKTKDLYAKWDYYDDEQRAWRAAIKEDELKLNPKYFVMLNPHLTLQTNNDGTPKDVMLEYLDPAQGLDLVMQEETALARENP